MFGACEAATVASATTGGAAAASEGLLKYGSDISAIIVSLFINAFIHFDGSIPEGRYIREGKSVTFVNLLPV